MQTFYEWLLTESTQEIVNLGFPSVIAKAFYSMFGKRAFLLARWFKEYYTAGRYENDDDWWRKSRVISLKDSLYDLITLYNGTNSSEDYKKALDHLDFDDSKEFYDDDYLSSQRIELERQIKELFERNIFFTAYTINKDIISGKLKDLGPYKNLNFDDANKKYEEKTVFRDTEAFKVYPNGFKWINVGKSCNLVGKEMGNCGSAGVMSLDPDRTLFVLFSPSNKPHVIITYSPNEKRISGDEGGASTAVKPEYHDYVLDLAKTLNVKFDVSRTKSELLRLKYLLGNKANNIEELYPNEIYDKLFKFNINGQDYLTNGRDVMDYTQIKDIEKRFNNGEIQVPTLKNPIIKSVFNYRTMPELSAIGYKFIPLNSIT